MFVSLIVFSFNQAFGNTYLEQVNQALLKKEREKRANKFIAVKQQLPLCILKYNGPVKITNSVKTAISRAQIIQDYDEKYLRQEFGHAKLSSVKLVVIQDTNMEFISAGKQQKLIVEAGEDTGVQQSVISQAQFTRIQTLLKLHICLAGFVWTELQTTLESDLKKMPFLCARIHRFRVDRRPLRVENYVACYFQSYPDSCERGLRMA